MNVNLVNEKPTTAKVGSLTPGSVFRLQDSHGGTAEANGWMILTSKSLDEFTFLAVCLTDGTVCEVNKRLSVVQAAYAEVTIKE